MLAIDHLVQARQLSQGEPRGRDWRLLSPQPCRVPVEVHLLPLDEMGEDVLDRPSAASHARHGHLTRRQEREAARPARAASVDLVQETFGCGVAVPIGALVPAVAAVSPCASAATVYDAAGRSSTAARRESASRTASSYHEPAATKCCALSHATEDSHHTPEREIGADDGRRASYVLSMARQGKPSPTSPDRCAVGTGWGRAYPRQRRRERHARRREPALRTFAMLRSASSITATPRSRAIVAVRSVLALSTRRI